MAVFSPFCPPEKAGCSKGMKPDTYRMYDMPDVVEESRCFEDFDNQRGKEERKELYLQALKQ